MASVTLGVKVDESLRDRLKSAAEQLDCSPHALHKRALIAYMEQIENGLSPEEIEALMQYGVVDADTQGESVVPHPFLEFASDVQSQSVLREAITSAYRRNESECVMRLIEQAKMPESEKIDALAKKLTETLRNRKSIGAVEGLIQEYALSTQEGIALMCLAEALLRIPDRATRDALIRDKIAKGDWKSHVKGSPSLFVNAATWGLMLCGKLVATSSEKNLSSALARIIGKGGGPLIRKGVNMAMRMMGEQFVSGQTIAEAIANNRKMQAKGFNYSYDMLGEAATTADDAAYYYSLYVQSIHAIGRANAGKGIYEGSGISIKLSALHPRYTRGQRDRVMTELYQRLKDLTLLARSYDVGINIDAEEADRLDLSLDLLEMLCGASELKGWDGIGFVVQAYQKRAPFVLDYLIDLAKRTNHRLMVRLVKGAYWDSEIKRAQVDGLEGYPVYTRKVYTDISYLVCARKLLDAPKQIFPQFATHNARTMASVYYLAGPNYYKGQYEFQGLYGMGEPLYRQVVGSVDKGKLARACRLYAPVGSYETLLPYLVRRLLENGANTSFVNLVGNHGKPIEDLTADPVAIAKTISPLGAPHPAIPLPRELYGRPDEGARVNSMGLDLSNETRLSSLSGALLGSVALTWRSMPMLGEAMPWDDSRAVNVLNPSDHRDVVGQVICANEAEIKKALEYAVSAAPIWQTTLVHDRAMCLRRAANLMEDQMQTLMGLVVREAGKSLPNAIAEVREAVDFMRYYADQAEHELYSDQIRPLGPVLCISPWNFPVAIFAGQVCAALAAGNPVIAKPSNQTTLVAAFVVRMLREAGIPSEVVQLVPGRGSEIGSHLVASPKIRAIMFTGSTEVAQGMNRTLAQRLDENGHTIALIAETGGQNAMIVDSSALAEQVVYDVIASAFDSAGQRCSALRILCVQNDVAERILKLLKGAMQELRVGNPDNLAVDVGPVIDKEAQSTILSHIEAMREAGNPVFQVPLEAQCAYGTFVPPTLIEIKNISELKREVFGPVLHVVRFERDNIDNVIAQINATGYGLTFGLHTRLNETIERASEQVHVGNIYVNRNVIGAVVGVQPFGGVGLSGTGPKAGGPLYLYRLVRPFQSDLPKWAQPGAGAAWPVSLTMPGPTGESNVYKLKPRGMVLCLAQSEVGLNAQWDAVKKTGCRALFADNPAARAWVEAGNAQGATQIEFVSDAEIDTEMFDSVLFEGDSDALIALSQRIAARPGPILTVQGLTTEALAAGESYALERLLDEVSVSINTAAAGGNASLMTID